MKDAFDIIKELIKQSNENMFATYYLNDHRPNGNRNHCISVECNGGIHFITYASDSSSTEITISTAIRLIEKDLGY